MTRMHSSRMCAACLLTVSRSAPWVVCPSPICRLPRYRPPRMQTPALDADPPGCRPPRCRPRPQMQTPWMQNPPDSDPRGCRTLQMLTLPDADTPMNRMTDRCKNITLPQTALAGGNKELLSMITYLSCPGGHSIFR